MKRNVIVICSLMFGGAAQAQQTYPLTCRGGGSGTSGLTLGLSTQDNSALVYYTKAPGSTPAGLAPGQCSWQDRAIGPNEPPCLRQRNPGAVAWIFASPAQRPNSYYSSSSGEHWLRDLLDSNKYITFQAYNPGDGNCFVVTRLGF
ncbi:MAG TPA: hypothetical protein VE954_00450 [Oligoflexus sp.]|uniref:hypothetical protein n=1 Tax=Oligoflexus sp. TaxID=1971216 RepID=UPI002D490064|nr:hypothetical protein [Oligoflexus sp.]HYX31548.1 hypothetical protein [Oligoflexus sp.]